MNDSLSSKLKSAEDAMPDRYTLAWWREQWEEVQKGYRGATHGINRCQADYENCWKASVSSQEEIAALKRDRDVTDAIIGKLEARVGVLEARMDKSATVYANLLAKLNGGKNDKST